MSYISEILDTNEAINERYRSTKFPKFIQKHIISHYKKKLIKIIDKINPDYLPADAIFDFAAALEKKYPLGDYKGIHKSSRVSASAPMYSIEVPVVIDNIIDATVRVEIMKRELQDVDYYLKIQVRTWTTNTGRSSGMYSTSFTRYQALSTNACNDLLQAGVYTKYKSAVFNELMNILYTAIREFLLEEVDTKGLHLS